MDFRKLINAVSLLEAAEIKATRRVQDNGGLTNFNIDRDDPFKLFTNLRTGSEDYTPDDIIKVYYRDDARLETFLGTNVGRRAQEVDADGNPVEAPQTDDELDADSADSGAGDSAAAQNAAPQTDAELDADSADNSGIRLSDGTSFNPDDEQSRNEAAQKLDELIRKYNDLIGRMSESAPVSIRGYLKEYGLLEAFIAEELSPEETEELRSVIADINQLADSGILSEPNTAAARQAIADAPELPRAAAAPTVDSDEETADDADSADSGTPDAPPEADEVSADSGDQDATVEPGEGSTSSSLEAFASSGKGGLANDADETAAIEELQQFLTDMGIDPNGVDGKYGNGTINAVREFQGIFGATQDGDAGPETIGKIVEYRNDLKEMDDLIAAAGAGSTTPNDAAGGGDVESTADSPVAAESRSWRDLITLVETMFVTEALDDTQRARAEELIAKYEALVGNLPEPAKTTVQEKIDALKAAMQGRELDQIQNDPGDDAEAPSGAVYKEVTGSGQSRRYTTYDADGREVSSGRGAGPNLPTQDEYTAQLSQPTGDGPEADGARAALSQVRPDPADVGQTVEPRPTESGVQGDYARAAWDRQYDATHNTDGTPKAGAEEPEAGAEEPEAATGDQPSSDLDQRIARYEAMPRETTEQITAWMQALKDDEELFNLLSQADQTAINTFLNGAGN